MSEQPVRFTVSWPEPDDNGNVEVHIFCKRGDDHAVRIPWGRAIPVRPDEAAEFERIHASHEGVCDALEKAAADLEVTADFLDRRGEKRLAGTIQSIRYDAERARAALALARPDASRIDTTAEGDG